MMSPSSILGHYFKKKRERQMIALWPQLVVYNFYMWRKVTVFSRKLCKVLGMGINLRYGVENCNRKQRHVSHFYLFHIRQTGKNNIK